MPGQHGGSRPKPSKCERSLANETRVTELEYAISQIKWDIIGISETRRKGYNTIEDRDNYRLYLHGETKGRNGVGFLVRKQTNITVLDFKGITERAALIKVKMYGKEFTIAQTYAPTSSSDEKEIEEFYKTLETIVDHSTSRFIFLGDMNAKIGVPKEEESRVLGKYGYGKRNKRGEKFVQFCLQNNLKITNTMFMKTPKLRWTWRSPDGN
ncbi:putative endonuclease-reverse transcriptase, partial [Operophtera brumata]